MGLLDPLSKRINPVVPGDTLEPLGETLIRAEPEPGELIIE